MTEKTLIAPSILSADFSRMGEAVAGLSAWGADLVHVDIMDGAFVPNITFGPQMVKAIRPYTDLPFDVHLMIERPGDWVEAFASAGADYITFHAEAERHIHKVLQSIRQAGCKGGLCLNPATPVQVVEHVLPLLNMVVVMGVNPGFGGQSFIPDVLEKIKAIRAMAEAHGREDLLIEVDGGVNPKTAPLCRAAGANLLVAGSSVFGAEDKKAMIEILRCGV